MDPTMMAASLSMASAQAAQSYSIAMTKQAMGAEMEEAAELLEMLPEPGLAAAARPQTGDVPLIPKGTYLDVYA